MATLRQLLLVRRPPATSAASFRQPPHAGDWLRLPAVIMCAWTCSRLVVTYTNPDVTASESRVGLLGFRSRSVRPSFVFSLKEWVSLLVAGFNQLERI